MSDLQVGFPANAVQSKHKGLIHNVDAVCLSPPCDNQQEPRTSLSRRLTWKSRLQSMLCCFTSRGAHLKVSGGLDPSRVRPSSPWVTVSQRALTYGQSCVIGPVASRDEGKITLILDLDGMYLFMMYLFTTVPHPHGHWQLQELLGNLCMCPTKSSLDDTSVRSLTTLIVSLL